MTCPLPRSTLAVNLSFARVPISRRLKRATRRPPEKSPLSKRSPSPLSPTTKHRRVGARLSSTVNPLRMLFRFSFTDMYASATNVVFEFQISSNDPQSSPQTTYMWQGQCNDFIDKTETTISEAGPEGPCDHCLFEE